MRRLSSQRASGMARNARPCLFRRQTKLYAGHIHRQMQTAKRAGAGIEIAGDGDRHLIAAQQFYRRALRLAQKIKRAGQ